MTHALKTKTQMIWFQDCLNDIKDLIAPKIEYEVVIQAEGSLLGVVGQVRRLRNGERFVTIGCGADHANFPLTKEAVANLREFVNALEKMALSEKH